jgi:hypothetical protein
MTPTHDGIITESWKQEIKKMAKMKKISKGKIFAPLIYTIFLVLKRWVFCHPGKK